MRKTILERKRPESRKAKRRKNTLDRKILDSRKNRKKHFLQKGQKEKTRLQLETYERKKERKQMKEKTRLLKDK